MEIYENLSLENIDGEIWKEIEGYNGDYFISNLGRVKSFKKNCGINEKILKPDKDGGGYLFVGLYKNGKPKHKLIHILMYEYFIEKIPDGYVVHRKDFTTDNFLDNFQLITNGDHTSLHRTGKTTSEETKKLISEKRIGKYLGENSPNHILTEQDVIQIRKLYDEGILTQREIGKMFGVSNYTVSLIKLGKTWKHIKLDTKEVK